ncbi:MAG: NYN domain-containing protein [Actinomycetota bacterium]
MQELPDDVTAVLARGIGAYVRTTSLADLPAGLKRFKRFAATDKGLIPHRSSLLQSLDDEATRALIAQWLDKRPPLAKSEAELLRLASMRPEGWLEELSARGRGPRPTKAPDSGLQEALQREQEKTRKAREEARRAKEEARAEVTGARGRIAELESHAAELRSRLSAATEEADAALRELAKATADSENRLRRARRDLDRAHSEIEELRRTVKEQRKKETAPRRTPAPRKTRRAPAPAESEPKTSEGPRAPLPAPLGRLADEPETLFTWLQEPGAHLVVDGYNVAKAEGGYGELELAAQRERVTDGVARLARRTKAKATIVFDGSDVAPGASRRRSGAVRVEYSAPGEIADDHLVALLEKLPPDPVIVVTNDKELQERVADLGATVATSGQLLALIR